MASDPIQPGARTAVPPAGDKASPGRRRFAESIRREIVRFLIRNLARLNRPGSRFYLQYRPDADLAYGRIGTAAADMAQLQAWWGRGMETNNLGDLTRLYFLEATVRQLQSAGVAGSFAELGVYKGNSAKILHALAPDRRLFLFDTFGGFDDADVDAEKGAVNAQVKRRDFADTSLPGVREFVGAAPSVTYCPGRFPDTASHVPEGTRFALVQLDCDLYAPIKAGVEFFYPLLNPGGVLIIHDYASGHWPGVKLAVDEFLAGKPEGLVLIPDKSGSAVLVKHRYVIDAV